MSSAARKGRSPAPHRGQQPAWPRSSPTPSRQTSRTQPRRNHERNIRCLPKNLRTNCAASSPGQRPSIQNPAQARQRLLQRNYRPGSRPPAACRRHHGRSGRRDQCVLGLGVSGVFGCGPAPGTRRGHDPYRGFHTYPQRRRHRHADRAQQPDDRPRHAPAGTASKTASRPWSRPTPTARRTPCHPVCCLSSYPTAPLCCPGPARTLTQSPPTPCS